MSPQVSIIITYLQIYKYQQACLTSLLCDNRNDYYFGILTNHHSISSGSDKQFGKLMTNISLPLHPQIITFSYFPHKGINNQQSRQTITNDQQLILLHC